jgi:predicted nuclease of predicted toxin-antitoxin system
MMLKFKVDENLPTEAAELLVSAGHDAVTVRDQRMVGQPDTNVATVCQQEQRVVVTLDLDFADIRAYPPADHAGIIVFRLTLLDKFHVLSVLQRLLPVLEREPLVGKLWIVDESSVRVRG